MGENLRTFVAIDIPATPLHGVLEELARLGSPLKMAALPLHLTLKFLGNTDAAALERISAAIATVCALHEPLQLEISGVGAFPTVKRPSVVWAGIHPSQPLAALAAGLDARLAPLGFTPERRAFHPHVTLARVKGRPPAALCELMALYAEEVFGIATVGETLFYQSLLTPAGPQYTVLRRMALGGATPTD